MTTGAVDKAFTIFPCDNSCPKCGWIVDYGCGCANGKMTLPLVPYDPQHPNVRRQENDQHNM
jgi:hypothetical protein